jgi:hypothetical protein
MTLLLPLLPLLLLVATASAPPGTPPGPGLTAAHVSVLPGGAVQVDAGGGSQFMLRSVFTSGTSSSGGSEPPVQFHLGRDATNGTSGAWRVTVDSSRAAAGLWSVAAVGDAFRVQRTVRLAGARVGFNDSITATRTPGHPWLQKLPAGALLGLQVQHILQFPASTNSHAGRVCHLDGS